MSRAQAYLILIVCNSFGALGVAGGVQAYLSAEDSSRWPSVQATITLSEIAGEYTDSVKSYWVVRPSIKYAYEVEGQAFEGDRLTFRSIKRSFGMAEHGLERLLNKYPVGQPVQVYFNPADPSQSVLEAGGSTDMLMPTLIGLSIMLFSTTFVVAVASQAILPRPLWRWLRPKVADGARIDELGAGSGLDLSWANEVRETLCRWQPGVKVVLKNSHGDPIRRFFESAMIAAFLSVVVGVVLILLSYRGTMIVDSASVAAMYVFGVATGTLHAIAYVQDPRSTTTIDWATDSYAVSRDFARGRVGSINDIQGVVVRCHRPRKHERRYLATIELALPEENIMIAQNDRLRRKAISATRSVMELAERLAQALSVPSTLKGVSDDEK